MKIRFVIICLIISLSIISSQNLKFGWISDTHIGYKGADAELQEVVNSINLQTDIKFVVATGDITEKGKNDELETAKIILDKLTVPYYIIPGNHDTKWSESGGTKFFELWNDDKFSFSIDSLLFIGLNSGIPWRGGGGHFSPADLRWLKSELVKSDSNAEIYFFSHHQLTEEIDNSYKAINILSEYNLAAVFNGHHHKNQISYPNKIPTAMTRSTLSKNENSWGYSIVEIGQNQLTFFETNKIEKNKVWDKITKVKNLKIKLVKPSIPDAGSDKFLWEYNFENTMSPQLLVSDEKLYSVTELNSEMSLVSCLDTLGAIVWQSEEYGNIKSRPVMTEGILSIATLQGDLLTFNAETGGPIQSIGFDDAITSQLITIQYTGTKKLMIPKDSESNAAIVLGTSSGKLYCYDLETLEEIWMNKSAAGMIETRPLFYENKIIYGSWDGYLYCIDARTGLLIWKWSNKKNFYYSPAACIPVTNGKNVFVCTPDKFVYAIDLRLGNTVWSKDEYQAWESIGISQIGHRLFIKSYKEKFHIVSAKTGKWVKELNPKIGIDTMPIEPIEWNGDVLFSSKNGCVYQVDNKFKLEKLFNLGSSRVHSVMHVVNNKFAVSNLDGKIVMFEISN